MKTKEKIIEEFDKGHKGEEMMEVAEARAEILIALSQQKQEIFNKIFDFITEEIKRADELRKEELRERFIVLASKISEFKITLDENVSNN